MTFKVFIIRGNNRFSGTFWKRSPKLFSFLDYTNHGTNAHYLDDSPPL